MICPMESNSVWRSNSAMTSSEPLTDPSLRAAISSLPVERPFADLGQYCRCMELSGCSCSGKSSVFQRFVSLVLDLVVALTLWFGVQEVASTFTGHRPYFSEQIWLVGGFAMGTLWILGLVCSYPLRWRPLMKGPDGAQIGWRSTPRSRGSRRAGAT